MVILVGGGIFVHHFSIKSISFQLKSWHQMLTLKVSILTPDAVVSESGLAPSK